MLLDKPPTDQGSENTQAWLKCENHISGCPFVRKGAELHVEISEDECCHGEEWGDREQNSETPECPVKDLVPLPLF